MKIDLPQRKRLRLREFDYNSTGAYFITICTKERKAILSNIVGGDVLDAPNSQQSNICRLELSEFGKIADKYINQLDDFYDHIEVDQYVVMPNHIHMMLLIHGNGASRTSPPTRQHSSIAQFVSTFKRFCNKEVGENIWQRGYNDHVVRDREDYEKRVKYIYENPLRWYFDELYENK